MRSSGSLCGSFFSKQTATTHALSHFALDHFSRLEMAGCQSFFLRPALQRIARSLLPPSRICTPEATLFPYGAMGTLTMALCPQAQIVLILAMEIGRFHQTARHQRNRSKNPSPARSRAPANRIHPPSRPADRSVPGQKLRFVCNDDIRAAGFIKGITDISIGQNNWHPAVQTDAREDRPPPFRSSIQSLISPKPSSPTSHHRTA